MRRQGLSARMTPMCPEQTPACAPAPPVHRGRPADARGAQLLASGQPLHAQPAGGVGRAPRGVGDPRRGRRRAGLPARHVVRPGGARWSSRSGPASGRRPACSPPPVRRTTCWRWRSGGPASRRPWPRWQRRARRTCGSARSTRCGRSEHLVAPGSVAELWTFFPDPWPKTRHHKRRLVNASFAALGRRRGSPPAAPGGSPPTGPTTPTRCTAVLDAEPGLTGGRDRALGGAAGHEVRAQGSRGGPHHHRPDLHPRVTAG